MIPYAVASVLYQIKTGWVTKNFSPNHPFFTSSFWVSGQHLPDKLGRYEILVGQMECTMTLMKASGVPIYISQGIRLVELGDQFNSFKNEISLKLDEMRYD